MRDRISLVSKGLFRQTLVIKLGVRCRGGKEQREDKAQAPLGCAARAFSVVTSSERHADWLLADLQNLTHHEIQRHGPLTLLPVVSRFGVHGEGRVRLRGVGDKRLQEGRANVAPVIVAGETPDVIRQRADGPGAFLHEANRCWSRTPLFTAKKILRRGWVEENRTKSPNQSTWPRLLR